MQNRKTENGPELFPECEIDLPELPTLEYCSGSDTDALYLFRQLNGKEKRQILSTMETMIHG